MKIVCDACQAKYSISDDKVQGKVFKIRCKKCSNIIVVRGSSAAAEPAPSPQQEKETHVYDYGYQGGAPAADDAVWHVVINQDQVGPMTVADVQARFNAGEIDAETYVWREGFADWMPLNQVDVFASFTAAAAVVPASQGGGGHAAVAAMFGSGGDDVGTSRSDPGDLFAAASSSRRHEDDGGGDLFGSAPAASQQPQAAQKLRGERNENSVLFSLNNLAALASDKPAPASSSSSSASSSPAGHATGAAGGEGSGLIDIRSMASAYLGNAGAAAKPVSAGTGSIDDLPVFGGGGFHEPAVLVPTARPANNNKLLFIMFGAVGLLAVAALVMVVILIKGNKGGDGKDNKVAAADMKNAVDDNGKPADKTDKPDTKPTATNGGSATAPAPNTSDTKPDDKQDTKTADSSGSTDTKPADPKPATAPDPKKDTKTPPKTVAKNPQVARVDRTPQKGLDPNVVKAVGGGDKKTDKKTDKTPPSDAGGGGDCDEVSCTIGTASGPCCAKYLKKGGGGGKSSGGGGGGGGGSSNLPDNLDRDSISAGMAPVKSRAMACGDKAPGVHGVVKVHVKVGAGGNVTSVSVSQSPDDKLGNCVSAAVQRASFAKTQHGGSFSIPYTF